MDYSKNNDEYRYLSVSEYAEMIGKSTTHIYGMIARNELETIPFQRGNYNGYIIKIKK